VQFPRPPSAVRITCPQKSFRLFATSSANLFREIRPQILYLDIGHEYDFVMSVFAYCPSVKHVVVSDIMQCDDADVVPSFSSLVGASINCDPEYKGQVESLGGMQHWMHVFLENASTSLSSIRLVDFDISAFENSTEMSTLNESMDALRRRIATSQARGVRLEDRSGALITL
jgi:hypothetical protein